MLNFLKRRKDESEFEDEFYNEDYYDVNSNNASSFDEEETEDTKPASGVSFSGGGAPVALKVVKPKNYDEGPEIADYLLNGSTVLLNTELLDKNSLKRLLDFLLGVTHVLGGTMNMVATGTFVFAPRSVGVSDMTAEEEVEETAEDTIE